jgi:hypothetical protein
MKMALKRMTLISSHPTSQVDGISLPRHTTDKDGNRYILRTHKIPLWRLYECNISLGEQFFFQKIVLNHASFDFDQEKGLDNSWESFFNRLRLAGVFNGRISEEELETIVRDQEFLPSQQTLQQDPSYQTDEPLDDMLATLTLHQRFVYESIIQQPTGIRLVHGGGGVGKSYMLRMLKLGLEAQGFKVLKLAPTGVAANTISGQTIHKFLGLNNRPGVANPVRLDECLKELEGKRKLVLLVDEVSMVSKSLLDLLSLS